MDIEDMLQQLREEFSKMLKSLKREDEINFTDSATNLELMALLLFENDQEDESIEEEEIAERAAMLYQLLHEFVDFKISMAIFDEENMQAILEDMRDIIINVTTINKKDLEQKKKDIKQASEELQESIEKTNIALLSDRLSKKIPIEQFVTTQTSKSKKTTKKKKTETKE